jgi:hypothetical protein
LGRVQISADTDGGCHQALLVAAGHQAPCDWIEAIETRSQGRDGFVGACDKHTGALDQVSDAGSALGVAVGDGRRRRCAECVCVERQRHQRLQQPERRSRRLRRRNLSRRLLRRRLLRHRLCMWLLLRTRLLVVLLRGQLGATYSLERAQELLRIWRSKRAAHTSTPPPGYLESARELLRRDRLEAEIERGHQTVEQVAAVR